MNLTNLFGKKTNTPQPEYFLAVEIHESLIKTALWEVLDGEPSVINVGSYESWADEESLINGTDSSLEQSVKVISAQPKRVIFGLPDSWMEDDKIHPTKIKLVSRLCKELGLEPIGAVTINRAVAHFLKKRDGVPPTAILLEIYTTKIALSYIYLGEVKATEEVAKSGDIGSDIEEGLTRMDLPNYPARFILTNGSDLSDEAQQVTAYPWQDHLPFKHLPKVEALSVDFSIKAIALIGGTEAVRFMGLEIKEEEEEKQLPKVAATSGSHAHAVSEKVNPENDLESSETEEFVFSEEDNSISESDNLQIPEGDAPTMQEHGFFYEEVSVPEEISSEPQPQTTASDFSLEDQIEEEPSVITIPVSPKPKFSFNKIKFLKLPKIPTLGLPKQKFKLLPLLAIPLALLLGIGSYFFFGKATVSLYFVPQPFSQTLTITVADAPRPNTPTLVATTQTVSASTKETAATTGTATVGDKAAGKISIYNRSVAPIELKAGSTVASENGKNIYVLASPVTIASKSADLLSGSEVFGKASDIAVTSTKIGAEHNLSKDSTFSVNDFSRTVAYAVAETEITGGTSRTVNAVSKTDQDKLIEIATEKIKQITDSQVSAATPGKKTIPYTPLQLTKKTFDKNIGEESTTLSLDLEGNLETLVYNEQDLFSLVDSQLKSKLPPGNTLSPNSTNIKVESTQKSGADYIANITVTASLYPEIDEEKLKDFVKGKSITKIRHFFEPIKGFTNAEVKISPPIPFITQYLPLKNISFDLIAN